MLFVDGENLTKRGQEVLKSEGVRLSSGPFWRRDVFLWAPGTPADYAFFHEIGWRSPVEKEWRGPRVIRARRAYYYTSTSSDEPEWTGTRLALRSAGFEPRLFKRAGGRSKAVDIALTTEVLTLGAERRFEVAVIFAGDGDYVPLIEAAKRMGLHVLIGFFASSGLSSEVRISADQFVDLTQEFVSAWKRDAKAREQAADKGQALEVQENAGGDADSNV